MSLSRVTIPGDGSTTQFAVNFALGILSRDNVTVRVGNEIDGAGNPAYRNITWLSDSLIEVLGPPAAMGVPVVFDRKTTRTALAVDFENGDEFSEDNLNTAQKQAIMLAHEALDGKFDTLVYDLDFGGFRGINAADPVGNKDVANKQYVDSRTGNLANVAAEIGQLAPAVGDIQVLAPMSAQILDVASIKNQIQTLASVSGVLDGTASALSLKTDVFNSDGATTDFALSQPVFSKNNVDVWVGGSIQENSDFDIIGGNTVRISPAVPTGSRIIIKTRAMVSSNEVKNYRDEAAAYAASINTSNFLAKTGGTLTGPLSLTGTLTADGSAAGIKTQNRNSTDYWQMYSQTGLLTFYWGAEGMQGGTAGAKATLDYSTGDFRAIGDLYAKGSKVITASTFQNYGVPSTGGVFTGSVECTTFFRSRGTVAGFLTQNRNSNDFWTMYSSGGYLRFYWGAEGGTGIAGDRMTLRYDNGDLSVTGDIYSKNSPVITANTISGYIAVSGSQIATAYSQLGYENLGTYFWSARNSSSGSFQGQQAAASTIGAVNGSWKCMSINASGSLWLRYA